MSISSSNIPSVQPVCIVTHPICSEHLTGTSHPECPKRLDAIVESLANAHLMTKDNTILAAQASKAQILTCHTATYYETVENEVKNASPTGNTTLSTGDTQICLQSLNAALYAAGSVVKAIDVVMAKTARTAFCLIRPPGHHAYTNAGGGFCLFNNVAIGARYAQQVYGIKKVLIVDWDVHHGNGTQEIFYNDPSVFYFSTHNSCNYPGTGKAEETGDGDAQGTTLNCPIAPGRKSSEHVKHAFTNQLTAAMSLFRPELVLISAGFDAHYLDPLGGFNLEDQDFADLTQIVKEIAAKYAQGRIVSVLEGGYDVTNGGLASAVKAHVAALAS